MKNSFNVTLVLPLLLGHGHLQAQIYVCKDASGHTITSDRPIPECSKLPMRELNKHGVTRRQIPAPLTAEQKHEQKLQDEKIKLEQAASAERMRNDRAIRARYRSEADIEAARERTLRPLRESVARERAALLAAEENWKKAVAEAQAWKTKSAAVPPAVQRKIEDAAAAITDRSRFLEQQEGELHRISARFDETLQRYRELTATSVPE